MTFEDRGAAFAALRQHPDFAAWMTHDPDALTARGCRDLAGLLGLLAVGTVLAVLCVAFLPQLALVPIALLVIGAVALVAQLLRGKRNKAPLQRWPAAVLEVRAGFASDGGTGGHSTYSATLVDEEDAPHVLETSSSGVTAPLQKGLYGVAFTRGSELVLFVPLVS